MGYASEASDVAERLSIIRSAKHLGEA